MKQQLKYYDVKLEAQAPVLITYRVLAASPEEAVLLAEKASPVSVKPNILRKKNLKATVYDSGTTLIRFLKNFVR